MLFDTPSEVQNKAVGFTWMRPQPPSNHLGEKPRRQGRPQQDDAVNMRRIKPLGEDIDTTYCPNPLSLKILNELVADISFRFAGNARCMYAMFP
jgi:hypothetical protein